VISSVSKGWGAPGLRVGWAVGDPVILASAATVHSYATTSPSHVCQKAATALILNSEQILPQAREELQVRWKALHQGLADHFSIEAVAPDGTFYYFLKLPTHAHADPMQFAIRLRDEAKVVTIPGLAFGEGGRQRLRVSFAARPDQISEGIRRIAPYWRESPARP
jgi:aspartate/methionine/tyrosine aminotransferase